MNYVSDFETTGIETYKIEEKTRVWYYNIREINTLEIVNEGYDISKFFDWITTTKFNENPTIYFHNLKFDGSFIVDYLLRNGYKHDESRKPYTFSTLISDLGVWYAIYIYIPKGKKTRKISIYDSLKKLPFTVEEIANAFDIEVKKGKIDYSKVREIGYIPTKEEIEYGRNDTYIVAKALQFETKEEAKKMTTASQALSDLIDRIGDTNFKFLFPELKFEWDKQIRKSYRGGYTYLQKEFMGKELKNVISFDVNSLYPSVMYDKLYPYGTPKLYNGKYKYDDEYPLYICCIQCRLKLKKNHLPTIQLKGYALFCPTEYIESTGDEIVELWLTSVDYDLMIKHYNLYEIKYCGGFKFKALAGIFKDYIDYWYNEKLTHTGALKTRAKLKLNSMYGKFGINPVHRKLVPTLDKNKVIYVHDEGTIDKTLYTAVACFVTAYAREKTISSAQQVYKRFIYADTDSIHLLGEEFPKNIEIDSKKLGAWKYEGLATRAKFLRAKTYIKEKNNELIVTCAGMPKDIKTQCSFENFNAGEKFTGKLITKKVEGGTMLYPTEFTIKL